MHLPVQAFDYRLFDIELVKELYRHKSRIRPDAYLSETWNGELEAIRSAAAAGYRWIRTEGQLAVFEKSIEQSLLSDLQIPRHVAAAAMTVEKPDVPFARGVMYSPNSLDGRSGAKPKR